MKWTAPGSHPFLHVCDHPLLLPCLISRLQAPGAAVCPTFFRSHKHPPVFCLEERRLISHTHDVPLRGCDALRRLWWCRNPPDGAATAFQGPWESARLVLRWCCQNSSCGKCLLTAPWSEWPTRRRGSWSDAPPTQELGARAVLES